MAHTLKKNTENQSIAAAVLRLSVGRANAASSAQAGRESISTRSSPPQSRLAAEVTTTQLKGTAMCRCITWRRQRHNVHSAMGQAGHRNHSHCRTTAKTWSILWKLPNCHVHSPSASLVAADRTEAAITQATNLRTSG